MAARPGVHHPRTVDEDVPLAPEAPSAAGPQRLALLHPDVAALRRYLVEAGFMRREASVYELRPREAWPAP